MKMDELNIVILFLGILIGEIAHLEKDQLIELYFRDGSKERGVLGFHTIRKNELDVLLKRYKIVRKFR